MQFTKATKARAKARVALIGTSGSGKTYSALAVGCAMGDRVAVIDTEHGSASKYAGEFAFDVLELETFSPTTYCEAIEAAEAAGYDVLIIDSLSHAWSGKDGALEQVDNAAGRAGNKFTAWRDVTPQHNRLIDAIVGCKCHVIATMRSKTEYILDESDKGKKVPRKVGMAPVQRDGMEYEFDVVGDLDDRHSLKVTKTRCRALDGKYIDRPGADLAGVLMEWLSDGVEPAEKPRAIGVSGKERLVGLCASYEAQGADKRALWQVVLDYVSETGAGGVSELTEAAIPELEYRIGEAAEKAKDAPDFDGPSAGNTGRLPVNEEAA